jgi:hypothetical protein
MATIRITAEFTRITIRKITETKIKITASVQEIMTIITTTMIMAITIG